MSQSTSRYRATETRRKGERFRHRILPIDSLRERFEGPQRPTNKPRGMRNWANICSSVTNISSYEVSELNSYLVCKCTEAWQFCFSAFCYFLKTCLVISLTCTLASCWWDGMNWVGWVVEDTIDHFDHSFTLKNVRSTLIRL